MARSTSPLYETLVLFVLVYALQVVVAATGHGSVFDTLFVLSPPLESDPWTVVTSVYAHAGLEHLAANVVGLVLFGWPIARGTSRRRFHTFFVASGATAGVAHVVAGEMLPALATGGVLGASGAVFALAGYLLASNRVADGIAHRVTLPYWAVVVAFVALAVVITIVTGSPGAALVAHFVGLLIGLFSGRAKLL